MTRRTCGMLVLLVAGLVAGCVERKYVITSDPPGAIVYRNGQYLGATPVDDHFVYYGKYNYTLIKEGYETLHVEQVIPAPWYQWPFVDFFTENVYPFTLKDTHRFHYQMQLMQLPSSDEVLNQGELLRSRGRQLGPLPGTQPQPVTPPPPPAQPPQP